MAEPVSDTAAMVAGMRPALCAGRYVYASVPWGQEGDAPLREALAVMREEEGLSLLLPVEVAVARGLPAEPVMAQITLRVHSSVLGVGLTAAVATALTAEGVPCNVIAAALHDHVFVPEAMAARAVTALERLAAGG